MRHLGRDTPMADQLGDAAPGAQNTAHVVVLGAVGGAGVSTLVRLLGPFAVDVGRQLTRPDGRPLLIVTDSTARGLYAATAAVRAALNAGHIAPLVAIVGDGPWPAARQARARRRMLDDRSLTSVVVDVPYVTGWREHDDPLTTAAVPAALRRAVEQLAAAAVTAVAPAHQV